MGTNKWRREARKCRFLEKEAAMGKGRSECNGKVRGVFKKAKRLRKEREMTLIEDEKQKGMGKEAIMQNANERNRSDKDEIDIGESDERGEELQRRN